MESWLEIEFETHFQRFLMPTIRGSDKGSKKRYAGHDVDSARMAIRTLVFKGLESVRSDWTALAQSISAAALPPGVFESTLPGIG